MFKYPVPGAYFRTDLGHFFKNDYHNYFWLQMSQISFFARFPDVDSKIRETTVMRITISPHVLHHHFVLTPWRSSNDPRAEYGTILSYCRSYHTCLFHSLLRKDSCTYLIEHFARIPTAFVNARGCIVPYYTVKPYVESSSLVLTCSNVSKQNQR